MAGPAADVREARALAACVALALAAVTLAGPHPAQALAAVTDAAPGQPLAPIAAAAALIAWLLAGWLALVLATTAAGGLPGWAGRCAAVIAHRIAPRTVRRVLQLVLGLSVATGAVTAPAIAEARQPVRAELSVDWPVAPAAGPITTPPTYDWPVTGAPVTAAARDHVATQPAPVVVRAGDTLWDLAAEQLPADAGPAAIAQAWPAWWTANRAVIGDDPDLIRPGTRLVPPPTSR
jgi:nucleoid-associated protein YgaU